LALPPSPTRRSSDLGLRLRRHRADEEAEIVGRDGSANLGSALPVELEKLARDLERYQEGHVGVAASAGPHRRLGARGAGDPDGRMWLLQWQAPRVHVAEVVVPALPAKRPGIHPALQDQIVA